MVRKEVQFYSRTFTLHVSIVMMMLVMTVCCTDTHTHPPVGNKIRIHRWGIRSVPTGGA